MENQDNQNIQPDYSFIFDRPGEQTSPPPKFEGGHKSRKKLIILTVCLLVVLGVLTVAALLVGPQQTKTTTSQTSTSSPFKTNPVDQLLSSMRQGDYDGAAALLPGDEASEVQLAANLKDVATKTNLETCKVSKLQGSKNNSLSNLSCRSADGTYGIVFRCVVAEYEGQPIIASYNFEVVN